MGLLYVFEDPKGGRKVVDGIEALDKAMNEPGVGRVYREVLECQRPGAAGAPSLSRFAPDDAIDVLEERESKAAAIARAHVDAAKRALETDPNNPDAAVKLTTAQAILIEIEGA